MSSREAFDAFLTSMLESSCNRVSRVPGVTAITASPSPNSNQPDAGTIPASGDYTDTETHDRVRDQQPADAARVGYMDTRLHNRVDDSTLLERAAIIEHDGNLPREIADGLAILDCMPPPTGYSDTQWSDTVAAMAAFVDEYGAKAIKLGWTAEDLFGLNPHAPAARYDGRGLASFLKKGDRVVMLTEDAAVIERPSGGKVTFRRRAEDAPSVLAWELDMVA